MMVGQVYGVFQVIDESHPFVFAYTRTHGREIYLVALNFSNECVEWEIPQPHGGGWSVVKSVNNWTQSDEMLKTNLQLGPFEGIVCTRKGG